MHRLPGLEVNVDLSLRLLSARCAGHGDVKGRLTHLPHTTFSRFKKVREVAQQNRVRDSYPHGRKNAWCGYRHISSFPADQDEVTPDLFRQTLLGTKGCSSLISVKFEAFRTSIRVPKEVIRPRKGSASGSLVPFVRGPGQSVRSGCASASVLSKHPNGGVRVKCLPDAQVQIELQAPLAVVEHVEEGDLDDALLD